MDLTGALYGDYIGGATVTRFGVGAGAGLQGLFAASIGDYGVVLLSEDAGALFPVGRYWRRFGLDLVHDDDLTEGGD